MLNPRTLSVLLEVGAVMLQKGQWIACRQEPLTVLVSSGFVRATGTNPESVKKILWLKNILG